MRKRMYVQTEKEKIYKRGERSNNYIFDGNNTKRNSQHRMLLLHGIPIKVMIRKSQGLTLTTNSYIF